MDLYQHATHSLFADPCCLLRGCAAELSSRSSSPCGEDCSTQGHVQVAQQMGGQAPPPAQGGSSNFFNLPAGDLRPQPFYSSMDPSQQGTHFPAAADPSKRSLPEGDPDGASKRMRPPGPGPPGGMYAFPPGAPMGSMGPPPMQYPGPGPGPAPHAVG